MGGQQLQYHLLDDGATSDVLYLLDQMPTVLYKHGNFAHEHALRLVLDGRYKVNT